MNNQELDAILRTARVPKRPPEYWEEFGGKVQLAIRQSDRGSIRRATGPRGTWLRPILGFAFASACIVLLLVLNLPHRETSLLVAEQVNGAAKYFREIQSLFPNQLETIIFDRSGARLVLSDRPDVPASPPLYLKICGENQCRSFVTFSGQEIRLDGQTFQVLVDRQGAVMVVGEQWVWSSSTPDDKAGRYRIAARPLPTT